MRSLASFVKVGLTFPPPIFMDTFEMASACHGPHVSLVTVGGDPKCSWVKSPGKAWYRKGQSCSYTGEDN